MAETHTPSEVSPLLQATLLHPESTIDPLPTGTGVNGYTHVESTSKPGTGQDASNEDGDEPATREGPANLYQGLPEVKKQLKYILPAVTIGVFLAAADQTLVASSAGKIGSDLKNLESTQWIATAYFLTLTTFQPLYGKLSDVWGRKECLLFAYLVFSFGCLWCGLSTTMGSLVAARAFAGIGGGGMTTLVSVLMSDIVPLRERGTWQGVINIVYAAGAGIGAPLGGILCDTIGWQWAFIGQFPLCLVSFAAVLFALRLPKQNKENWKAKMRRVDFLGAFTLVVAVSCLLIGLDRGSNVSWKSTTTIVFLTIAVPLIAIFIYIELRVAQEPFAPGRIIFDRKLTGAFLCNFFAAAGWFGVFFYLPIYYQAVQNLSPTQAGLRLLPGILAGVIGSLTGGIIMQRTGRYYWLTVFSYALLILGSIPMLLFTGAVEHSTLGISVGLSLGALGIGSGVTTTLIALISNTAAEDQAITTASSYLFRSLGSVLGLSAQSALFQALLRIRLEERLGGGKEAARLADKIRESFEYTKSLSPELQELVRKAYGNTISSLFGLIIFILSGAMISSFFIKETKLSR